MSGIEVILSGMSGALLFWLVVIFPYPFTGWFTIKQTKTPVVLEPRLELRGVSLNSYIGTRTSPGSIGGDVTNITIQRKPSLYGVIKALKQIEKQKQKQMLPKQHPGEPTLHDSQEIDPADIPKKK